MAKWILIKDIMGQVGFPTTPQGVAKKAIMEKWQRRRVEGVKGNVYEYNIESMPKQTQEMLGFIAVNPIKTILPLDRIVLDGYEQLLIKFYRQLSYEKRLELLNHIKSLEGDTKQEG